MSNFMLLAILRTPHNLNDTFSMLQLRNCAVQAADEIERLEEKNREIQKSFDDFILKGSKS